MDYSIIIKSMSFFQIFAMLTSPFLAVEVIIRPGSSGRSFGGGWRGRGPEMREIQRDFSNIDIWLVINDG